jgi:hypothetical protein
MIYIKKGFNAPSAMGHAVLSWLTGCPVLLYVCGCRVVDTSSSSLGAVLSLVGCVEWVLMDCIGDWTMIPLVRLPFPFPYTPLQTPSRDCLVARLLV